MFDPKLTIASAAWIFGAMLLLWLLSLKLRDSSIVDIFWGGESMGRRPGWEEYARRTSAFFPRPPKK